MGNSDGKFYPKHFLIHFQSILTLLGLLTSYWDFLLVFNRVSLLFTFLCLHFQVIFMESHTPRNPLLRALPSPLIDHLKILDNTVNFLLVYFLKLMADVYLGNYLG